MKTGMRGECALTYSQIQATRLNEIEYRRLKQNLDILQDNLKTHLGNLQRQAHDLKDYYTNVVRVVKPNPTHISLKEEYLDPIRKYHIENSSVLTKMKSKRLKRAVSSNEIHEESTRPLLALLIDDQNKNSIESTINFNGNFLRPNTSPNKRHFSDIHRKHTLTNMFQDSKQQSEHSPTKSANIHRIRYTNSNFDIFNRMNSQNQIDYKSNDQKHIEQHRTMKSIIRSATYIK